ncbi:unnamed protein product [Eruca vesicaria subsp. sativa]|uniref:Ferulate 5-hydroxylase n=1 Tax=Eruca vesicaria subsp. sativa TaxID=29727 RepID=A0ABC8KE43_ERUVS|nr:unnamed protein product [Eruca vesicaria subsp. sativa]
MVVFDTVLLPRRNPFPPGPKGYPIIGNMKLKNQLNHRGLAELAKQYGGLFHLQMGRIHIVAASTAEMAREILQVHDVVFANRPANVAISYLTYNRADMAFANYGPLWRQMRKVCVMKLFSRKRAESWASVRDEINTMVQTLTKQTGSPVNVGELVFALTRNITYRAAFGSFARDGQDEFVKILQEFSKLFGAFDITEFLPWMKWFSNRDFTKRLENARESLDGFIDIIIDAHIEKKNTRKQDDDGFEDDMVDELMAFYSGENDVFNAAGISFVCTKIQAFIPFIHGFRDSQLVPSKALKTSVFFVTRSFVLLFSRRIGFLGALGAA